MRLPSDQERVRETIAAAAGAGVTVFDTARAYGGGQNERLIAGALRDCGAAGGARIVTKGGMTRMGEAWVPDGRAKAILADCEASLQALDGLAIDLYLIHAPDPRTPWRTSVRALARLLDAGLVRHVGVSNVNRPQLDEALALAPIAAVQVALSIYDDRALRGGIVERCAELDVALIAHSPLGGPRRAGALARHPAVGEVAQARGASPAEIALAWLLDLAPVVVPIPGARRPETARSAARATRLALRDADRSALGRGLRSAQPARATGREQADVVLVMGIPGAGKTRIAQQYVDRGYVRLNRDERGGGLRDLAQALDDALASGVRRVVLDNTYLTRAARSYVIDATRRHGTAPRCIWLDTPLAQAQVNIVERMLERFGCLPAPEKLRALARREPGLLMPTSQMRALRELERPSIDEGLAGVEVVPFARVTAVPRPRRAVLVAAAALQRAGWERALERDAPHLIFDWRPHGAVEALAPLVARLAAHVSGPVEAAVCPHPGGPPSCWCRPPLPGLPLAFARAHQTDPSILIGTTATHRTLAATLGAECVLV